MPKNSTTFHLSRLILFPYFWPFLLLIGANGLIITPTPLSLRYAAALILLAFLPGWVWLNAFFDYQASDRREISLSDDKRKASPLLDIPERITLAIGLSIALTIFGAMFAVYLPGPLSLAQLLIMINGFIIAGLAAIWWQHRSSAPPPPRAPAPPLPRLLVSSLILLAALLLLAAALRLPRLGYAEFHEDEAEALMLGVRLLQGEDYALFLHRKGPAQMLVPLAFWLLTGQITEAMARFPFALSSILSVATLFIIGRRWFNGRAGAIAGLLWAINGYAIAFGRMVQYQALIFFLGPLALYCLYLAGLEGWKVGGWEGWRVGGLAGWRVGRWQILGAILLAACLLAHFDALLLLPAAAYLGWVAVSRGGEEVSDSAIASSAPLPPCSSAPLLRSRLAPAAIALILFLALLASFYIPYLLDPEFKNTANYLAESRVKPGLLYNNLDLLRSLDKEYSSQFYLPLLVVGMVGFVVGLGIKRWLSPSATHFQSPDFAEPTKWPADEVPQGEAKRSGQRGQAKAPYGQDKSASHQKFGVETKAAWLMFGAGFIGYVFLVDDPRTHLYIMYPGAALLAGAGWAGLVRPLTADPFDTPFGRRASRRPPLGLGENPVKSKGGLRPASLSRLLSSFLLIIVALLVGGTVIYEAIIFLPTESTLEGLHQRWDGSLGKVVYDDLPKVREYFGYPKSEGWKAIGALRAQGLFPGDFRSINEDFIIPIWYNYGQARSCYDTPAQFFVRTPGYEFFIPEKQIEQYTEVGWIEREGEVRLRVFSAMNRPGSFGASGKIIAPPIYTLEALADAFDQLATPQRFIRQAEPSRPVATQFGAAIQFLGYDLPKTTVAPGETLYVNLYWRALQSPADNYRAFVHLTDGTNLWGQQDDDPACRLPTSVWRPGQRGLGQFRLSIKPETSPGHYPLIIGLYQTDTLERLKITSGAGQVGDDFLWLGDVEVSR